MTRIITDENKIKELLSARYIERIFPSKEKAEEMFLSGKRLSFYWGVDPTGPDIHLGNITNLLFLKKIISLGHKVILLIGDFTAQTGDPTGKNTTRKILTEKKVKKNMETYLSQVMKILPKKSFEVKYNSSWLKKLSFQDIREIARRISVQQVIARNMFKKRLKEGEQITIEEFLYPLMQGYDSVALEIDGEIGGNDQMFNMLIGRDLVKSMLGKEKIVITTKLLEDPATGKKLMNKSEGRYVSLNDSPDDMFGKIMAMPDSVILSLYSYTTEVSDKKIEEIKKRLKSSENPKALKEELAFELVKMYHSEKNAVKAKENFKATFQKHETPKNIPLIPVSGGKIEIVDFLVKNKISSSASDAKRVIQQGGIKIDGQIIDRWGEKLEIKDSSILQVGPRRFYKLKVG